MHNLHARQSPLCTTSPMRTITSQKVDWHAGYAARSGILSGMSCGSLPCYIEKVREVQSLQRWVEAGVEEFGGGLALWYALGGYPLPTKLLQHDCGPMRWSSDIMRWK